jgi:hypothetical protein
MVGVMSFFPLKELPALFPQVVDWISYLEKQVIASLDETGMNVESGGHQTGSEGSL